jgi:hypothetical protein
LTARSGAQHFPIDLKGLGRVRVGGNGFIDQLIGLCGVLRIQQLGELNLWHHRARIQVHRVAQHRCDRVLIGQTGRGGADRGSDFESGVSITRVDQIQDVGKFVLAKRGIGENWQIIHLFTSKAGTKCISPQSRWMSSTSSSERPGNHAAVFGDHRGS